MSIRTVQSHLVDSKGRRKAIIVKIEEYGRLLKLAKDMRDLNFIVRHQRDELIPMISVHKRAK